MLSHSFESQPIRNYIQEMCYWKQSVNAVGYYRKIWEMHVQISKSRNRLILVSWGFSQNGMVLPGLQRAVHQRKPHGYQSYGELGKAEEQSQAKD